MAVEQYKITVKYLFPVQIFRIIIQVGWEELYIMIIVLFFQLKMVCFLKIVPMVMEGGY